MIDEIHQIFEIQDINLDSHLSCSKAEVMTIFD